ncbi:D-2-hydroxyacid dehydrogenase family protein, partial [Vibrio vulnificus]|nr:D-2-hydroxyacid dehydrogenase family protein [Vibrio vulnificus]
VEKNSYELYFRYAFDNIVAFAHGQAQNIVNPEVLSPSE